MEEEKKNPAERFGVRDPSKPRKGKPGQSYPHRLLTALARIFEDPDVSIAEKLQAMELSAKVLPMRVTPRRKTEKERLVLESLKRKKKVEPKSDPEE